MQDVPMKDYFSKAFRSLIEGLLQKNPKFRLTIPQIKEHPFFKKVKWTEVPLCQQKPPLKPKVKNEQDISNFDKRITQMDPLERSPSS